MSIALISAGSNLGDSRALLRRGIEELQHCAGEVLAISSLYRTKPVGGVEQPDFLNLAFTLRTELTALALLEKMQAVEQSCGRRRLLRWGPRTLDLDLIAFDKLQSADNKLTLPHPRAALRAFVLVPACEIAPDFALPAPYGIMAAPADIKAALTALISRDPECLNEVENIGSLNG